MRLILHSDMVGMFTSLEEAMRQQAKRPRAQVVITTCDCNAAAKRQLIQGSGVGLDLLPCDADSAAAPYNFHTE